jgi:hypothetical protein
MYDHQRTIIQDVSSALDITLGDDFLTKFPSIWVLFSMVTGLRTCNSQLGNTSYVTLKSRWIT